jgi:hypothetical protein
MRQTVCRLDDVLFEVNAKLTIPATISIMFYHTHLLGLLGNNANALVCFFELFSS